MPLVRPHPDLWSADSATLSTDQCSGCSADLELILRNAR